MADYGQKSQRRLTLSPHITSQHRKPHNPLTAGMSSESLLKLPSVLLATIGLQLCFTLPGVSAQSDKAPVLDRWDRFMKMMGKLMRPIKVGTY